MYYSRNTHRKVSLSSCVHCTHVEWAAILAGCLQMGMEMSATRWAAVMELDFASALQNGDKELGCVFPQVAIRSRTVRSQSMIMQRIHKPQGSEVDPRFGSGGAPVRAPGTDLKNSDYWSKIAACEASGKLQDPPLRSRAILWSRSLQMQMGRCHMSRGNSSLKIRLDTQRG